MGHFVCKYKKNLDDIKIGEKLQESDYATITEKGQFVQFKYVEDPDENSTNYPVKAGIWAIKENSAGLYLTKTDFVKDNILNDFFQVQEVTDKVECFFRNFETYYDMGIEIPKRSMLFYGPPGCHAKGTKIIMADGSIKKVEDIQTGDQLMGPDSKPREVLQLCRNREKMVKIKPIKGEEFTVNYNHILHLVPSHKNDTFRCGLNIKVSDYIENTSKVFKERFKLKRQSIEFDQKELKIDPYILGLWLGDGNTDAVSLTTNDKKIKDIWIDYGNRHELKSVIQQNLGASCETINLSAGSSKGKSRSHNPLVTKFREYGLLGNKHIPFEYLTSSREQRLQLLAGLIDSDGYTDSKHIDYITKQEKLADNIVYLCRSLGLAAYKTETVKSCIYKGEKKEGTYFRLSISGHTDMIPIILDRKKCDQRKQIKDVTHTGFSYEILPEDNYYGFTLDKDHLYLASDFIIHHNTGKTSSINKICEQYRDDNTAIVIWPTDRFEAYQVKKFIQCFEYKGVDKLILIIEDIGGSEIHQREAKSDSSLLSLLDNKEKTFKIPVLIMATTNYPENFMGNLTNRPERFDDKMEVGFPDGDQRFKLLKFFGEKYVSKETLEEIRKKDYAKFTPAHLKEIVIRSRIYEVDPLEVMNQIKKEIKEYEKAFTKTHGVGFNG